MSDGKPDAIDQLLNLTDAIADSVMNMSDEEIKAELELESSATTYRPDEFTEMQALALGQTIDAVLGAGFRINNLYQCDNGLWIASLRDRNNGYSMGQSYEAADALDAALASAKAGNGDPLIDPSGKTQIDHTSTSSSRLAKPSGGPATAVDLDLDLG